jgi:hypothetical protein
MNERKASDVLLSVEKEVKQHTQLLRNIDMLLKNLANRISLLEKKPTSPTTPQVASVQPIIPGLKPGVVFKNGKLVKESQEEEFQFEEVLEVETNPIGQRRTARTDNQPVEVRKTPVQQRILYKDGKPVTLARVEVLDLKGNVVYGYKTNNMGKWAQPFAPGNYTVNISRKGTSTKPPVELSYTIEVPNSNKPVQLPDVEA